MAAPEQGPLRTAAVSAIIVSYDAGDDLARCVRSLMGQECAVEVIVVDNGSRDGSVQRARVDYPDIRVIQDGINDGFAGGANRGASAARGEVLLFLNPDVILEPGCAAALCSALSGGPSPMVCAPVVVDVSRQIVEHGLTIDCVGDPVGLLAPGAPLYLGGCALATTRDAFTALGGFDVAFFMFCEDLDLCWRALLHGGDVRVVPAARVRHRGGASTSGGYVSDGRIEVTAFRISLRERNTLSTMVRCGPLAWVAVVVALRLARIGIVGLLAVASGRPDLARALARGVAWNIRRLPELLRQRRALPATAALRRKILSERMRRDINSLRVLFRHGLPRFVDRGG
jgi:GT2 family glycosyltransferase